MCLRRHDLTGGGKVGEEYKNVYRPSANLAEGESGKISPRGRILISPSAGSDEGRVVGF